MGGAEHEDGGLLTRDGPLLAKRKIILDGAEHVDGRLFALNVSEKKKNIAEAGQSFKVGGLRHETPSVQVCGLRQEF